MTSFDSNNADVDSADSAIDRFVQPGERKRSWPLEILGLISIVGFFIGIALAWRTQVDNLITAEEFQQLKPGQTIAEVDDILGTHGQQVPATENSPGEITYQWENSSDSLVSAVFIEGKLVRKFAKNLP